MSSDLHLEKTTQTDLLYGLALEHHSDVVLADEERDASDAPVGVVESSSAIQNFAATRADSSLAAIRGLLRGRRIAGQRWAYPQGWAPPVRKVEPSLVRADAAHVEVAPIQPRSLAQIAADTMRGSQAWFVSLAIHLCLLPGLALLAYPEVVTRPTESLRGASMNKHEPIEVIEVPAAEALPTSHELTHVEPVSIEFALPEPRFERGAMPGLLASEAATLSPLAVKSSGPVSDIYGLMAEDGRGKTRAGKGQGGAEFFGLKATGSRFVFVVDCSLSMSENNRWLSAVNELNAAIDRLTDQQLFYVILFDGNVHRMFNHDQSQAALFPATKENKQRFREWLATARLGYDTYPLLAVRNALELSPDAIYILSDGVFRDGTADFLKKVNRPFNHQGFPQHQAAVHTLSFHSWEGQPVMKRIARENKGKFLFIK